MISSRVSSTFSDLITCHQCNSTMTVMSSWSRYIKSYEAKCCYELHSPTNAQFQHNSCVGLEELPSKLVSHAYVTLRNKSDISCFAPLVTFSDFQQDFTNFLCLISGYQCNSTITVMSSWSQYLRSYEAKYCYKLPSPTNAQVWHDSCVGLEELPSKLVSHAYLIFRNKWDISCFAPLMTFGDFQ